MTLFELQAWLGHRCPSSTQHYARITPMTLAKAYTDAGYFAHNVRAIEVLVDRDAVQSGAAAAGAPWQHFDLGHGYWTYNFFEQCPHRTACARCEYYVRKGSTQAQLLEAKRNLQKMLIEIPLTDEERAAVEEGGVAVDRLLDASATYPRHRDRHHDSSVSLHFRWRHRHTNEPWRTAGRRAPRISLRSRVRRFVGTHGPLR